MSTEHYSASSPLLLALSRGRQLQLVPGVTQPLDDEQVITAYIDTVSETGARLLRLAVHSEFFADEGMSFPFGQWFAIGFNRRLALHLSTSFTACGQVEEVVVVIV